MGSARIKPKANKGHDEGFKERPAQHVGAQLIRCAPRMKLA